MLKILRLPAAFAVLASVSLAACGGGGNSATESASSGTPQNNASSSSPTASAYSITGAVTGVTGVTVVLAGASTNSTRTNTSGTFNFTAVGSGNYTVAPNQTGYVFNPVSRAAIVTSAPVSDLSFSAAASTAPTYTLSGTVSGNASAGVIVTLNGVNVGSAVTDLAGNYTFSGLVSGTYTVGASLAGSAFSAPLIVSLGTVDSASNNFTSTAASTGGSVDFTQMSSLPQATVGSAYSASVVSSITGGTAPYYYQTATLTDGAPPLGMILNPNGDLTGTPMVPGQYDFSVCATDSADNTSPCQPISITVVPESTPPPSPPPSPPPAPAPSVSLTASPTSITSGASSTLTWSSTYASSCTSSGGWSGTRGTSGSLKQAPTSTTTYTLDCSNSTGSAKASSTITVKAAPPPPSPPSTPAPTVSLTASPTSITSGASSTLTWSSTNASSCTSSGGWSGARGTSGSLKLSPTSTTTYTLDCSNSTGSAKASSTITVNAAAPPPAPTPPATGTSWVYYNGLFDWPGDYSYDVTANYTDTSGAPLSGAHDIKITLTSAWGGWLPYAQNWNFNSAPYTKLTFALKPTVANQKWHVYFVKVGDIPVGISIDPANYGPAPVAGQWNTYTVPLADLGVLGTSIYKFCIQDQTGLNTNVWYVDNVGFAP